VHWLLATGAIAAWLAALERGDLDDVARRGARLGPAVIERELGSSDRARRLAAIVAAPAVEDRAELLAALARAAAAPDRRTAIPATRAARAIARDFAARERPDDIAPDDVDAWRAAFEQLARDDARFVEVRLAALDTAAALGGFELAPLFADRDPDVRARAIELVATPPPAAARAALARVVADDADPRVAIAAAQALCATMDGDRHPPRTGSSPDGSDPLGSAPVLAALGARGLDRIATLVAADARSPAARDAARCLSDRR
jgi:hypothetical protein